MEYGFAPILLDREICRDFSRSSCLEWLDTNETGGYAMGTVSGANTRRYHGLLVAALHPPFQRTVLLSRVEERVELASGSFDISTCSVKSGINPKGYELLDLFRLDPYPIWLWAINGCVFSKRVFLIKHKSAVAIQYTCDQPCSVDVRPCLAFRDYHQLMHENDLLNPAVEQAPNHFRMHPYEGLPSITFHFGDCGAFEPDGRWTCAIQYELERERGMDHKEDLYSPGCIRLKLEPSHTAWIVADVEENVVWDGARLSELAEEYRQKQVVANSPFEARLTAAATQFRAFKQDGTATVMAGFPWFAAWGRDTMISLPGLLITQGAFDDARSVMEGLLKHINQGLIPNQFPDIGPPEYNTMDATLWMFQAAWSYVQCGGGLNWIKEVFYPAAKNIIAWHERGTLYEIGVDPDDGLLRGGVDGTMLTWMDAKVGDWVVTPRRGKPIEVNALWFNALRIMLHWATEFEDLDYARKIRGLAKRAQHSFNTKFWNSQQNCAHDLLEESGDRPDGKLRPNQIFAVSLPFPLFDETQRQSIVKMVERELLTPVGLRSLARSDPDYRPRYEGDRVSRDGAYHNGTVWPWLMGPFVTAYLRAFGKSAENVAHCRALVDAFEPLVLTLGLGSIPEIFDGDPPHRPRGCIAQAWSVGELLRVLRSELA